MGESNEFNIEEAQVVIKEYKKDIEGLKNNLCQFLEERTLKTSSELKCVTIVVDQVANADNLKDVKTLSSAVLPQHFRLNVRRGHGGIILEQKSLTGIYDDSTARKDTTLTTEVPAGNSILLI